MHILFALLLELDNSWSTKCIECIYFFINKLYSLPKLWRSKVILFCGKVYNIDDFQL